MSHNTYKQTAVTTASRGQILLMLYEAAIRNTKKAMESIEKNDMTAKGNAIGKVHDIVNELANTLDHKVAGNIATDLERLYNFMVEQLLKANLENSKDALQQVLKLLETLYSGWKVAVEEFNKTGGK
ncbi:MAG: flagellar export chaperone FliS [Xanthomonadaceae bacterium]|nr:flagellar export chaperone FliS [Xanthomonadaceae bacterium]